MSVSHYSTKLGTLPSTFVETENVVEVPKSSQCGKASIPVISERGVIGMLVLHCGNARKCDTCRRIREDRIIDAVLTQLERTELYWRVVSNCEAKRIIACIRRKHVYLRLPQSNDECVLIVSDNARLRGDKFQENTDDLRYQVAMYAEQMPANTAMSHSLCKRDDRVIDVSERWKVISDPVSTGTLKHIANESGLTTVETRRDFTKYGGDRESTETFVANLFAFIESKKAKLAECTR